MKGAKHSSKKNLSVADVGRTVQGTPCGGVKIIGSSEHESRQARTQLVPWHVPPQGSGAQGMQLALTNHSSFHEAVSLVAHLPEMINAR